MPINVEVATAAPPAVQDFSWTAQDVLRYHLAVGAGSGPVDPPEGRRADETDLQVLPTFAVVAHSVHRFDPPRVRYPGISVDLRRVLYASQRIDLHRQLPTAAHARAASRITHIYDKGTAALMQFQSMVSPPATALRCGRTPPASSPAAREASVASAARPDRRLRLRSERPTGSS